VVRLHGVGAAPDAAEDDVSIDRTRHEGVAKRLAAVATVRGPPRARQKRGQGLVDEQDLAGLDLPVRNGVPAAVRFFAELDRG